MEKTVSKTSARTRSLAFCGLSIALMAVSAWITVPLGPVPFTLQTFVMVFVILALKPKEALASIGIYLVMGAIGLPVFSSMRGGISVLAGPTGGFLWGFFLGAIAAILVMKVMPSRSGKDVSAKRAFVLDLCVAVVFMVVCYACGWAWLAFSSGMSAQASFAAAVAPFILIDACKMVAAVLVAQAVRRAVH